MVLWSPRSVISRWVRAEATIADRCKTLVPVMIEACDRPIMFELTQTAELGHWQGDTRDKAWQAFLSDIYRFLGREAAALAPTVPASPIDPSIEDFEKLARRQQISFCRARDGVTLAYSRIGEGPPLVKSGNWLNHLEYEMESALWRHWIDELSRGRTLIRYDSRGNGMSDWRAPEITFDLMVDDFQSVVDATGLEQFDLVGISQGCPVAIAFAVRNPGRVKRMVLINGFAVGWRQSRDRELIESWEAMITLAKTGWGKNSAAFRQIFTSLIFPEATREHANWWNELQLKSANAENAVKYMEMFGKIDVRDLLGKVQIPTLVLHCRDDQFVPFEAGRHMASRIPGSEFVPLESSNHLPVVTDAAWPKLAQEIRRFLG